MLITDTRIYGLDESVLASGLPMADPVENGFAGGLTKMKRECGECFDEEFTEKQFNRASRLGRCEGGESHDCYLVGIVVQMNVTAPRYWWPEFQRYHFADIISSTSTMHRLKSFARKANKLLDEGKDHEYRRLVEEHFSPETDPYMSEAFMMFVLRLPLEEDGSVETIKANLPDGWLQTARITTNYRQLKTMYHQRKDHRLKEWRDFCGWIETLPKFKELVFHVDNVDATQDKQEN